MYFKKFFIVLIINILTCFTSGNIVKSQIPNDLAFSHLFEQFSAMGQGKYNSVKGFNYDLLKNYYQVDTSASEWLKIGVPDIDYKKVGKGKFVRTIATDFVYADTLIESERTFHLEQSDTLTRKQVKLSRDISVKPLRGESPFLAHKIVWPAVGTLAGFAAIISLFYVRS